jgi:hypothetical protein
MRLLIRLKNPERCHILERGRTERVLSNARIKPFHA